ncbi:MAG: DUF721 domain-containing protein [Bacteroidota bacterium]
MEKDSTQRIGEAMGQFLKSERLEKKFKEQQIIHSWKEIMGGPIANRTAKVWIKDSILFVKLTSAPLRQELTMSSEKVLHHLEDKLGRGVVEDIKFL